MPNIATKNSSKYHYSIFLYVIIFLEGYVVLATEMLAIRQLIPFVGSGTETIAIVIAAVLMPLSFGYYVGGNFTDNSKKKFASIKHKLIKNVVISSFILTIGLSYIFLDLFFPFLSYLGAKHRVIQVTIFSVLFLVYPIFLLGQTVPLISNYFKRFNFSKATGVILCISTIGSFSGSILSTLILMGTIGVHNVIIVNIALLFLVVLILNKKILSLSNALMAVILFIAIMLNSSMAMKRLNIVEDNNYNTIAAFDKEGRRILSINRSLSAIASENPSHRHEYIQYLEQHLIHSLSGNEDEGLPPKSMLVVGAGGFSFGHQDRFNKYTFIDIDSSLQRVAEEHFMKEKLKDNKQFIPIPARAFFNQTNEKYDLIVLDVYSNADSIPGHLITKEFFTKVKNHLTEGGIMVFFVCTSPNFEDKFSIKIDNTLREVFGVINRHPTTIFNPWRKTGTVGIVYTYYHKKYSSDNYTDDMNTYYLDR